MVNFPFLKTLILTDSITNYSKLAASIGPYDLSGDLVSFNKLNYQNLFILSPSTLAPSQKDILDFVNLGGNVVVSCNENSAPSIREFAYEFGVDFDNLHSVVKDPFNNGSFKNSIETSKYVGNKYALFSRGIAPKTLPKLLFSGLPHRLTGKNPLAQALIVAEDSAYSFAEKGK